jgi:hypothetical protein
MKDQNAIFIITTLSIGSYFIIDRNITFLITQSPLMNGMTAFYVTLFFFIILLAIWFLFRYGSTKNKKYEDFLYKIINFSSRIGFLGTVQALIMSMKDKNSSIAMALTTTLWGIIIAFLIELLMFLLEYKRDYSDEKVYEIQDLK